MNIIVAGCGGVGRTLVEQLAEEGHSITVVDNDERNLQAIASQYDVMDVLGNATSYVTQAEAGVEKADLLIAVTNQDEINMLACLIAKKSGHCQTIARVRNPQYYSEIEYIQEELALSMAVNPEHTAAFEMSRLIQIPSALEVDTFAKGRVELIEVQIPEDSKAAGLTLSELPHKIGVTALICVVERGSEVYIPGGDFELHAGDNIYVTIPLGELHDFLSHIGIKSKSIKKVLIGGGGNLGFYLAKTLLENHIQVKIIERDQKRCMELTELLPKAMVIHGDLTDKQLLLDEDIATTDAVVACSNRDEENLLLSLYSEKVTNAKIITRINRLSFEEVLTGLPVGTIITPKDITAEYIIRYVRSMQNSFGSNVETLYRMVDNRVEALEFRVSEGARVTQAPLSKLPIKDNTLICAISRHRRIIRPRGGDTIQPGDFVIVVTTNKGLNGVDEILK